MRFIIIRKADELTEAGTLPTEDQIAEMMEYNQRLLDAGMLLDGMGLHPSSNATRISFRGGEPAIVDGPFAEAKELIAGFTLIKANSREEALEWVRQWPEKDVDLELRQVFESEDFGEAFTPELQEQEAAMIEQAAQNK
ncbi:MAG: YciI family protein [Actinobacteria bacterium]|nr:YciI family protein [Actinomycetota bacterium]